MCFCKHQRNIGINFFRTLGLLETVQDDRTFIAFQKKTTQNLRIHKLMYYSIAFSLICFLIMNQTHHENTLIDYIVVFYVAAIVPLSKRWDVLVHALIAAVGLTLLPLLIIIQI